MDNIDSFREFISTPRKVVITTHYNPDADAIGSSLALYHYLRKKNHEVTVVTPSDYPDFLDWMRGEKQIVAYSPQTKNLCEELFESAEIIFCLDFSSYNRLQDIEGFFRKSQAKICVIDHHLEPNIRWDFSLWRPEASSTAELIFDFISLLGDKSLIDEVIGECIYAGIVTDTSSFKHPTTSKKVHLIVAELMDIGINTNKVQKLIYDTNTENKLRFTGYMLANKLKVLPEYKFAYFTISQEEQKRFQTQTGDTEGLVNYALSIKGIVMAATLIEKENEIRLSFRSIGDFAVNKLAKAHFEGGGHKNAAGGRSSLSLEATEKKLLELIPLYQEQMHKVEIPTY
ncbi:MAG: bifunctional oligoribonuclease/PAP phosphatase NrnA [Microscillaceae bacterium]|nr:bifunctional oligoribonuclease/PAP phosphatase NrnA [Microscillaceae bacterium]MDW8460969.1 bifunctional oligoribonuclease/PAP phosphatase NrnA [Cytophagales bacterium]